MEVETSFPADGETLELVESVEGLLDDVAQFAEADDVAFPLAGDDWQEASFCGSRRLGALLKPLSQSKASGRLRGAYGVPDAAGDRWNAVDQGEGPGDSVDVGRGGHHVERETTAVADQVVLAAGLAPTQVPPGDVGEDLPVGDRPAGRAARPRRLDHDLTSSVRACRSVHVAASLSGSPGRRISRALGARPAG
ncbi:hypothetical protein EH183_40890 [Streptomyces sp. CB01881]|uniref:hypothetical protein n=1 Tax=Streptomyces sp. CB01881 TaxID=2078691 RepID=UPI0011DF253E|nr:hypothetical protein [Streptomyces sp. CB01881]TYC68194.1 hypothetical protein EH183_40890 [Streptomyces sp. CB01881]